MAIWVQDLEDMVFSLIKAKTYSKLKKKYPNVRYTTVETSVEDAKFPNIYFRMISSNETNETMEGKTINSVSTAFQIDVTTNVSKAEAKDVIYTIIEELKKYSFEINTMPIFSVEDNVHRATARARRTIANRDILN